MIPGLSENVVDTGETSTAEVERFYVADNITDVSVLRKKRELLIMIGSFLVGHVVGTYIQKNRSKKAGEIMYDRCNRTPIFVTSASDKVMG